MCLKDTGILEKIRNDVLKPGIQILQPNVRHNQPLILQQLGIIMIVLVAGLIIATIGFMVELLNHKHTKLKILSKKGMELK